ncbi:MAG: inorganic phosphate transporter, partial [Rhodobiaceae bacterium]|nr:inorganic phosphate transporter [Rhodobiaceae bacterium]
MGKDSKTYRKPTLDKDLDKFGYMEEATTVLGRGIAAPGLALLFVVVCAFVAAGYVTGQSGAAVTVAAVVIGAYMALNIGANDVAN